MCAPPPPSPHPHRLENTYYVETDERGTNSFSSLADLGFVIHLGQFFPLMQFPLSSCMYDTFTVRGDGRVLRMAHDTPIHRRYTTLHLEQPFRLLSGHLELVF